MSATPTFAPPHPDPASVPADDPGRVPSVDCASQDRSSRDPIALVALLTGLACWPAGVVLSLVALRRIRRNGAPGRQMAVAGLILSILGFLGTVLLLVVALFLSDALERDPAPLPPPAAVEESSFGGGFSGSAATEPPLPSEEAVIETQRQDVRTLQATLTAVHIETGSFPLTDELDESLVVLHAGNHLVGYRSDDGREYSLKVTSDYSHTDLLFKSPVGGQLYRVPER